MDVACILLRGGTGADGAPLEVRCDPVSRTVVAAGPAVAGEPGDVTYDCAQMVILPAPAEPHAHLDKALTAEAVPNPAGDLTGAIVAWRAHAATLDEAEILGRARVAAHELVARGTTAIRSHVDVGHGVGLAGVHALVALREELARDGLADLQLVALPAVTGPDEDLRELLEAALDAGVDAVGACPQIHPDGCACVEVAVDVAAERDVMLDLHMDEALYPDRSFLSELIARVPAAGLGGRAVASHCVSLGTAPADEQRTIAAAAAAAGVAFVALPQTNLFLQARGVVVAPPRGLTAVAALREAGCVVAAGADNVRDPFCTMGRSDALETAALLVMAAHLTPAAAWDAVSASARRAMGLPAVELRPGDPAEVLAVRGASLADAIARGSEERLTVHRGRVVASTTVTTALNPLVDLAGCP